MSDDSRRDSFQSRVQRLRSLRTKLCDQTSEWTEAFELRDYVIGELQDMLCELNRPCSAPEEDQTRGAWCKSRVENILEQLCALPPSHGDSNV